MTERIFSKSLLRALVFSLILMTLISFLPIWFSRVPLWIIIGYLGIVTLTFYLPFHVMVILSFNRDARRFIIRSSEFWIKILYGLSFPILMFLLHHYAGRKKDSILREVPEWLVYTTLIAFAMDLPLMMAIVGGMDAIPRMGYKFKVYIIGLSATMFTMSAFYFQLVALAKDDFVFEVRVTGSEVSLHSLLTSNSMMLAMFLWKQTIDVIRNKDRCVSIVYRPYLRWTATTEEAQMLESVIRAAHFKTKWILFVYNRF